MKPLGLLVVGMVLLGTVRVVAGVMVEDLSWGEVEIKLEAEPAEVDLTRDLNVVIKVASPGGMAVKLPDLRGRFQGFSLAEGFEREPLRLPDGRQSREYRWRLVPEVAVEYRLAPFAVVVMEGADASRSFATRPVVFPVAGRGVPEGDLELELKPYWITPTRRQIFQMLLLGGLAAVVVAFCYRLLRYLRRQVRLHRMSPRERAFDELERLLARRLLEAGLYKDFYIELTQVVRRYIERSHGIRAPRQTTEEFLESAGRHPRFTPEVLASLREFLESADLIKFAGQKADSDSADRAVGTAKKYIDKDAEGDKK